MNIISFDQRQRLMFHWKSATKHLLTQSKSPFIFCEHSTNIDLSGPHMSKHNFLISDARKEEKLSTHQLKWAASCWYCCGTVTWTNDELCSSSLTFYTSHTSLALTSPTTGLVTRVPSLNCPIASSWPRPWHWLSSLQPGHTQMLLHMM